MVSKFIVQALQGKPITIYGDGNQTRSFCYVDDLIEGFLRLMDAPDTVTGPINIGNPGEFTHPRTGRDGDRADRIALEASSRCRCPRTIRCSAARISRRRANCCELAADHSLAPGS